MIRGIPLVRATVLLPIIRYLERCGVPVDRRLQAADLGYFPYDNPERPISFIATLAFANKVAWSEGLPDLGCLVVVPDSVHDLGILGQVLLGASTVRGALVRVAETLRFFNSHHLIWLEETGGRATIVSSFSRVLDASMVCVAEQYTAMMLRRICEASGFRGPVFKRIAFQGQPFGGFEPLRPWFCDELVQSRDRVMRIELADGLLDRRYPHHLTRTAPMTPPAAWLPLRPGMSVSEATRYLVEAMLFDRVPGLDDIAQVAGMSVRTLQRRLHQEGTSYSDLLEDLRRQKALADVLDRNLSLAVVSSSLGYTAQGSFTRAFRRWTAESPRRYRRRSGTES